MLFSVVFQSAGGVAEPLPGSSGCEEGGAGDANAGAAIPALA